MTGRVANSSVESVEERVMLSFDVTFQNFFVSVLEAFLEPDWTAGL